MESLGKGIYKVYPFELASAFDNPVNPDLVLEYAMKDTDPPPIRGYIREVDDSDIGMMMLDGDRLEDCDVGMQIFYVTNGYHRSQAAILKGTPLLAEDIEATRNSRL